jgi:hypothetical protein
METLHTFLQIDAVQDLSAIFSTLGTPGLLIASVYYVVKELKRQYDDRISALERRSEECEKDRVALRDMIIKRDHAA